MTRSKNTTVNVACTLICVFFVFTVGITNLKSDPIENDEFRTLNHIEPVWLSEVRTIPETIRSVAALSPQHGPLYFVALNVWHKLAGSDLFALRLLSTFFGVLSISIVYRLAMVTGNRDDGIAAAVALAFLAFYMFHVHYLRMYTLLSFASGWALWSYWNVTTRRSLPRWRWISLLGAAAALSYIHYMGGLILAAIGVHHIVLVKRDKRWWQTLTVLAMAALLFLPWLPVVISGLAGHRSDAGAVRLSLIDGVRAILSISSNGILAVPMVVAGLALLNLRRLNKPERFLVIIPVLVVIFLIILNTFSPTFVANRMRYALVVFVPYCCMAVICLRTLSFWRRIRIPALLLWCLSFFYYLGTPDYAIYTNIQQHETAKIPPYQDFIYESERLPGHNELILSFHPNMILSSNKTLPYYRKILTDWAYIIHISYDANGDLIIQSDRTKYGSLDSIADNSRGIWVLHNPSETDLTSMPVFRDWFLQRFKLCKRFLDRETSAIDYYLKPEIPCGLVTDSSPLSIRYDNGIALGNIVTEMTSDALRIYLWWHETIGKEYALSLQVFDAAQAKVLQTDAVISSGPVDAFALDLSDIPPGEYNVDLIVYGRESMASVPGEVVDGGERFDRAFTIATFSTDDRT